MISTVNVKKNFKGEKYLPLYLFQGEEEFLIEELLACLACSFLGEDRSFGLEKIDGESASLEEIFEAAGERNIFSPRRILAVYNHPCFRPPRQQEQDKGAEIEKGGQATAGDRESSAVNGIMMERYLEQHLAQKPDSIIVFLSPRVDRRKKVCKIVEKAGGAVDCSFLKGQELFSWIKEKAASLGKKIDHAAMEKLALSSDLGLHFISAELEKYALFLSRNDEVIRAETVELLYSGPIKCKIFWLCDALAEGKNNRAMQLLERILQNREPPLQVFYMVARHYRLLIRARALIEEGAPPKEYASTLGAPSFAVNRLKRQAELHRNETLASVLTALQETDERIKTGCWEPVQALKMLLPRIDFIQRKIQPAG